jgi:hypothetical protein
VIIDRNEQEMEAMGLFRKGEEKKANQLQNRFLSDVKASGMDHCSCTADCRHHGHCVDCVIIHRGHQDHLPECFRDMVNRRFESISSLTEHTFRKT